MTRHILPIALIARVSSRCGIALLALLLFALSSAVSQWNWKSPLPQGNTLIRTTFIDTSLGWAVGEYGTIIHTTNGGVSWYEQEYGRSDNMLAIAMVSDTMGWAVGDNGVILYTTDAGDTWNEQTSGVDIGLNAVTFLNAQNGWAAGDHEAILHTTNGGTTWSLQHWSNSGTIGINSMTFFDLNTGWAVASNQTVFHDRRRSVMEREPRRCRRILLSLRLIRLDDTGIYRRNFGGDPPDK
jgi:photosystem II stability/assembly factor-like uncharacterized protein